MLTKRVFAAACLVLSGLASAQSVPTNFKLSGLEQGSLESKDLQGKYTIVQFFASWCTSCGATMATIDTWRTGRKGFAYLPVSVDESLSAAREFFIKQPPETRKLEAIAFLDVDAKLASGLDVEAIPAVLLLGKHGEVLMRVVGHPTREQLDRMQTLMTRGGV